MPLDIDRDWTDEFPILQQMAFFNHAGVAPISGRAARAMRDYVQQATDKAYVGSGWYARADKIREMAARLIGARSGWEIAFVSNTSSGLSLVAKGMRWQPGDEVVITNIEFPANRYPWVDLKHQGVKVVEVERRPDGSIDPEDLHEAVTNHTRVVAISHVQFASGQRMDLRAISDLVHQARGYLCVDAIQSVGAMPVDVRAMGIDFLAADGHKWLLGPEGAGIFYCRQELIEDLHPGVVGWRNMVDAQDYLNYRYDFRGDAVRFEPGSLNIPGVLALGASIEMFLELGMEAVWRRIEGLTTRLCDGLSAKGYHVISPRGDPRQRSGIVVFEPAAEAGKPAPAKIVADLEKQGIIIVLRDGRLRASPHFYNTLQQIDQLIHALP